MSCHAFIFPLRFTEPRCLPNRHCTLCFALQVHKRMAFSGQLWSSSTYQVSAYKLHHKASVSLLSFFFTSLHPIDPTQRRTVFIFLNQSGVFVSHHLSLIFHQFCHRESCFKSLSVHLSVLLYLLAEYLWFEV